MNAALAKNRLLIANGILLLVLVCSGWGQATESLSQAKTDFLRPLRLTFRGWKTEDVALTKDELTMLEPDATLVRRYTGPKGERAEIAVISGHKKRSVHTPGFCMIGGGWEIVQQGPGEIDLGDRKVPCQQMVLTHDRAAMLVAYFFTDGDFYTRDLPQYQWKQMVKRIRGKLPLGALVRITVPVRTTPTDADRLLREFAPEVVPDVLTALRNAGSGAQTAQKRPAADVG